MHCAVRAVPRAAASDGPETEDGEIPDHAACHLYQQDWGIPVVLQNDGDSELVLDLRGMDCRAAVVTCLRSSAAG